MTRSSGIKVLDRLSGTNSYYTNGSVLGQVPRLTSGPSLIDVLLSEVYCIYFDKTVISLQPSSI